MKYNYKEAVLEAVLDGIRWEWELAAEGCGADFSNRKALAAYRSDMDSVRYNGLCYADSLIRGYLLWDAIQEALDILEANVEISYDDDAVTVYICNPATV